MSTVNHGASASVRIAAEIVAIVDRVLLPALGVHGPTEDAHIRW